MIPVPLDYETLRLIWWLLLGVLLIAFAVTDGFDLGVGLLLPFVARTDIERRVALNAVGPVWEGNQVWFVLGGGAIFAAWPLVYAAAFSGLYFALFAVLLALILRPVGFDYRNKLADPRWRAGWDTALCLGGLVPALVFGVAFGNLLVGLPFTFDADLRMTWDGGFFDLFSPFTLLCGLVSLAMLAMHGAVWLAGKTEGPVRERAGRIASGASAALLMLFAVTGMRVGFGLDGFVITGGADPAGPSNPLLKEVAVEAGAWMANFARHPWMNLAPVSVFAGGLLVPLLLGRRRPVAAFWASAAAVAGVIATAGLALFPFLMPSILNPAASLTVWDASSSRLTLFVMLLACVIFLPLILAYTSWVYRVLRGTISEKTIRDNSHSLY